jgi:hypothetical protein
MREKIEIPKEVVDGGLEILEKELFPNPPKKTLGVIARLALSFVRIFVGGKKVKI